jgi:hypothetical protein
MLVLFIFGNVSTVVVSANCSKARADVFERKVYLVSVSNREGSSLSHVISIEDKKVHSYMRNSSCSFASSANTCISSYPDTSRLETETIALECSASTYYSFQGHLLPVPTAPPPIFSVSRKSSYTLLLRSFRW